MSGEAIVAVRRYADRRGALSVIESGIDIDFPIVRVYWLTGLDPARPRGFHAHRALRQLAVCLAGSCRMVLEYCDGRRREIAMAASGDAVLIGPMVWREMHEFSQDCVLMVLADKVHEESDYLRDYDEWRTACEG